MTLHPGSLSLAYDALREHGFAAATMRHACEMAAERGSYTIGRATITFDRENGYQVRDSGGVLMDLDGPESTVTDHRSADDYPVTVGAKFWNNDLRVVQITAIGTQDTREYADTGEHATWHKHTGGSSDTLTGHMRKYGRLARYCDGKDAENYEPGTNYSDIR
jgi:hypothetical protein